MEFKQDVNTRIEEALVRCGVNKEGFRSIEIPGDLSPRRYRRLETNSKEFSERFLVSSVVAMVFDSVKPPEAEAKIVRTSDEAFIELSEFFFKENFPVPKIYFEAKDIGVLLLEDLGEYPLINLAEGRDKQVPKFYSQAVSLIHQMQAIPKVSAFFPFERSFDEGILLREMGQFVEYVLPVDLAKVEIDLVEAIFKKLSAEICSFQKVLVHRDFHSWNLMVDLKGKLRVIDFQDALMGSRSYDLVALLHERDIDLILPEELVKSLEDQFFSFYGDDELRSCEYPRVQLQRDLKVSGLFMKVKKLRGLSSYERWVPGTLARIGRTLDSLALQDSDYAEFKKLLKAREVLK